MCEIQLHVLGDASLESMAVVAFIRAVEENETDVSFVLGKVRVAPMRQLSIPKLELQGALIASRLCKLSQNTIGTSVKS